MLARLLAPFLLLLTLTFCGCHYTKNMSLVSVWTPDYSKSHKYEKVLAKAFDAMEEEDLKVAESYFLSALEFDPKNEVILNNLGLIYFDQGKYYLAAKSFQEALVVSQSPEVQHNHLGQVWEAAKLYQNAEKEYRQAIGIDPSEVEFKSHLARVLRRQGRTDLETESLLAEVVKMDDREGWRDWANVQLVKIREENTRGTATSEIIHDSYDVAPEEIPGANIGGLPPAATEFVGGDTPLKPLVPVPKPSNAEKKK